MDTATVASALPAAFAVRAVTVALTLAVARRHRLARVVGFGGAALGSLAVAGIATAALAGHLQPSRVLWSHAASGFGVSFAIDGLSAWFLLVLSTLAVPVAVYSIGYAGHGTLARRSPFFAAAFNLLLLAVEGVFVADNAVAFLLAWEAMTLTATGLVATEHDGPGVPRAAFLYLVMSHVGTGCLFAAFLTLGASAGSLGFADLLAGHGVTGSTRTMVFVLFLAGFGVKAGIVPLHIWLPEAHPAAPSSISALMSGVLIKTGVYGLVRFAAFGLGPPTLADGLTILGIGAVSALLGVLYALMQHDLKRLLAYHSIENIGIILLGLGAGMIAVSAGRADLALIGLVASLYHVLNHAVFKGLLFLGAGGVAHATGTRQIERLGGLIPRMPWTAATFLVGALAISGLPPLNGFASEWLTFQALLYEFHALPSPLLRVLLPIAGAALALTAALAAACFVKAFGITFLALPRSPEAAAATESPLIMRWPQVFLAAACVALGLFPGTVVSTLTVVVDPLLGGTTAVGIGQGAVGMTPGAPAFDQVTPLAVLAALTGGAAIAWWWSGVRRRAAARVVPTWGCGGVLQAESEYTATAFSKPLMLIFAAVYRPTRQVDAQARGSVYFPHAVRYHAHIEPTFERFLYEPITRAVLGVAQRLRVLQAGSLHAYLAYVILLVLFLVLRVWWSS